MFGLWSKPRKADAKPAAASGPEANETAGILPALAAVDFAGVRHFSSIWDDSPHHVSDLNGALAEELADALFACAESRSPLGRIVVGQAGAGKTHLLGDLRRAVWERRGWFVLLDLGGVRDFWPTAALNYLDALHKPHPSGRTQGQELLARIAALRAATRPRNARQFDAIFLADDERILDLAARTLQVLRYDHWDRTQRYQHIIRAFVMHQGRNVAAWDEAMNWLQGVAVEGGRLGPAPTARDVVAALSWLMSLTGPTLLAIDQIDPIVTAAHHALDGGDPDTEEQRKARAIVDNLALGLMDLYDVTSRTLTVVTALEESWTALNRHALKSATARFSTPPARLALIPNAGVAQRVVAVRLAQAYAAHDIAPPYPTYPFRAEAFAGAVDMLPRDLLIRCREHLQRCLATGVITELTGFRTTGALQEAESDTDFDTSLRTLMANPLDGLPDIDDAPRFRRLLFDVLHCRGLELDPAGDITFAVDGDPDRVDPPLHARFRLIDRADGDREIYHCFRVLPHVQARAFQVRLKAAMTASGIDMALPFRHLVLIRQTKPPAGLVTAQLCADFDAAGGRMVAISPDELRTMVALQAMLQERTDGFEAWLRQRKLVSGLGLFCDADPGDPPDRALGGAETVSGYTENPSVAGNDRPLNTRSATVGRGIAALASIAARATGPRSVLQSPEPALVPPPPPPPPLQPRPDAAIPLGHRLIGGVAERPTALPLHLLTRHTAVLAGSGSGKTVLLRRIVEEAALLGVPAIVLDPNNDLARLGDPWPAPPASWTDTDRAKAEAYHRTVETIVWTPGLSGGNPVKLAPLPDFASVRDDPDELGQAIAMAMSSLGPLVGAQGMRGRLRRGVLNQVLAYFALTGFAPTGSAPIGAADLDALVRLLSDLPPGVSDIGNAAKLARAMADELKAAVASFPLFAAPGQPLDPRLLFTASTRGKTRVSVINLSGLPTDEGRQDFVNQLQMALFAFIKRNPPPAGRKLTGLFVMDEAQLFAPSQAATACKDSTIALAAQARKYGLGMLFATQVPKTIDNKIISNCATHLYGKMSSPASIQATQELIQSRGGAANDIGTLQTGQFYLATEGMAAPERIQTMLCLSHHPSATLTPQEVLQRARSGRAVVTQAGAAA